MALIGYSAAMLFALELLAGALIALWAFFVIVEAAERRAPLAVLVANVATARITLILARIALAALLVKLAVLALLSAG